MERIPNPKPAYVYDMDDETGKRVHGTRRSAAVPREKPKVSQRDRDGQRDGKTERRMSRLDQSFAAEEEQDTRIAQQKKQQYQQHTQLMQKDDARLERRNSIAGSTKSPRKSDRQPTAHQSRNYPPHLPHLDTSHQQQESHNPYIMSASSPLRTGPLSMSQQPNPIRPRPHSTQTLPARSSGYMHQPGNPNYGPPIAPSAFYAPHPQMAAPSFPLPSPAYSRFNLTLNGDAGEYFPPQFTPQASSRPLSSRFDPVPRTQSAFGGGGYPPPAQSTFDLVPRTTSAFGQHEAHPRALVASNSQEEGYYDDGYASASDGVAGARREPRDSIRVPSQAFTQQELNYRNMPPPARPSILRHPATEYRAPSDYTIDPVDTRHERRRSRDYYDESPRPRPQSTYTRSVSYNLGPELVTVESAKSSRRKQGTYDTPESSSAGVSSTYQDKIKNAKTYQEDVGGPTILLTAESLKKQQRRQAGSRSSTKSSASRDESDYKKSVTTRTTRSGSGNDDENATIKVTGKARVMVGNIAIDCTDGGAIEITQNKFGDDRTQKTSSDFGAPSPRFEDRRSRTERPPAPRTRMSSQSGQSFSRSRPQPHYGMDNENYF